MSGAKWGGGARCPAALWDELVASCSLRASHVAHVEPVDVEAVTSMLLGPCGLSGARIDAGLAMRNLAAAVALPRAARGGTVRLFRWAWCRHPDAQQRAQEADRSLPSVATLLVALNRPLSAMLRRSAVNRHRPAASDADPALPALPAEPAPSAPAAGAP